MFYIIQEVSPSSYSLSIQVCRTILLDQFREMPKVLSYTPPWLSRPEPGFQLFNSSQGTLSSIHSERRGSDHLSNRHATKPYQGPTKIVAHRGTEVFVAVDNKLRWSDLCMLKDDYDEKEALRKEKRQRQKSGQSADQNDSSNEEAGQKAPSFRVSSSQGMITPAHNHEGTPSQHRRENTAIISFPQRKPSGRCHITHCSCPSPPASFQTRPAR